MGEDREYRKLPVVVRAYRTDRDEVIHTLEGVVVARRGDYVVTGVQGERYPCRRDIFEATYEPVDNGEWPPRTETKAG